MTCRSSNNSLIAGAILLAILCGCAYSALLSNQFVSFDDGHYIVDNHFVKRGLTFDTIRWAFSFHEKPGTYWHPLTWLSLMLDYQLVGLNPSWFHLVNLIIHISSASILFYVLHGMTQSFGRSIVVAALFALHPLNVESVAWAAERKTVLCGVFFMLTILFYIRYARQSSPFRYLMVCGAFILGLMAKSMIVSLPIILLLLDIWPLGRYAGVACTLQSVPRYSMTRLILEKIPLCIFSSVSVAVSIFSLKDVHIFDERNLLPFGHKVANAVVSYPQYLWKIFWPSDLAVYYPVRLQLPVWQLIVSSAVIILFSAVAVKYVRKIPLLFVGWFWFLISLLPVIGLVRRGLWPAMADRFAYLPMIGILVLLVWGIADLVEKYAVDNKIQYSCAVLLIVSFAFVCHRQVSYWHDSGTLFQQAASVTKDNDIALANLGWYRFSEGKQQEALALFSQMTTIDPSKPDYEYAQGALLFNVGRYVSAAEWFEKALTRNEKHMATLFFLGLSYERSAMMEQAARNYIKLSDIKGLDPGGYRGKGEYRLGQIIQPALAPQIVLLEDSVSLSGDPDMRQNYIDALYRAGYWRKTVSEIQKIPSYQSNAEVLLLMADCERRLGNSAGAENILRSLLKSHPGQCSSALLLGRMAMDTGRWNDARQIFETELRSGSECPEAAFKRAFCYYATGRWHEALDVFQEVYDHYPQLQLAAYRYINRLQAF